MAEHPRRAVLDAAAAGSPPPPDGRIELLPAGDRTAAVVSFTAHHVVAAPITSDDLAAWLDPVDLTGPMRATFLVELSRRLGSRPGSLDVVLTAHQATGDPPVVLERRDDLLKHPRVRRAAAYRTALRVWADPASEAVLVLGRGLAGRLEVAYEVPEAQRGRGLGTALALAARTLAPDGEPVWAQTAPANVASLRALLAAGFRPVAAEVLFLVEGGRTTR